MGGLMSITGDTEPTKAGVAVVDVLTGLHATVGILAALRAGRGQHLQVSLLGSLLSSLVNQSAAYVGAGVGPGLMGNAHPSIAPYEVYATADRPMVIAVGNDGQFERFARVIGLAERQQYRTNTSRVAHRDALKADLEEQLGRQGADHWQRALTSGGVPCGPINDIRQAIALAQRVGLQPIADARGTATVANPVDYSATPATYRSAPPEVDADRQAVMDLLELS
jgi:crotonobetainyl-CoA:carnitine CoA-transferase CaiB-like acyl-CoA transferase